METFFEIIAYFRILLSPFLASIFLAIICYIYAPEKYRDYLCIAIVLLGLVTGIMWAYQIKKKGSADEYLSQIYSGDDRQEKE